jgi:hypothetical protein
VGGPGPAADPGPAPGWGREWRTIFLSVYALFRQPLAAHGEDDIWVSYALSYMALRRCARLGKHGEMAYVHRACVNAHKRYHKRLIRQRWRAALSGDLGRASAPPEPIDLMLDLEEVLGRLPARDAAICRMRLNEEQTFREIGATLGIDASTAHRQYERSIGVIRSALRVYLDETPDVVPIADTIVTRAAAAWESRRGPSRTRSTAGGPPTTRAWRTRSACPTLMRSPPRSSRICGPRWRSSRLSRKTWCAACQAVDRGAGSRGSRPSKKNSLSACSPGTMI